MENSTVYVVSPRSCILRASDYFAFHLRPVDLAVHFLVYFTTHHDIVTADQVQPMLNFRGGLLVVWGADDAFNGIGQDKIGRLIG